MTIPAFDEPRPLTEHILEFIDVMDRESLVNAKEYLEAILLATVNLFNICRNHNVDPSDFERGYWIVLMAYDMVKQRMGEKDEAQA